MGVSAFNGTCPLYFSEEVTMSDFKPNSNKSKELAKKVLKGTVKKKGEISKLVDIFISA